MIEHLKKLYLEYDSIKTHLVTISA